METASSDTFSSEQTLLTIAIPTFNRKTDVSRQLSVLQKELIGTTPGAVNIIVFDNASSDGTYEQISAEKENFNRLGMNFVAKRNDSNIGAIGNIALCISSAIGKFIWVLGDDDILTPGLLSEIVPKLASNDSCVGAFLNFRSLRPNGTVDVRNVLGQDDDERINGVDFTNRIISSSYWPLAFMSALIYRTDLAQRACKEWSQGVSNYDYMVYISAYVFSKGDVFLNGSVSVDYILGENVWRKDKSISINLNADKLEILDKLVQLGLNRSFIRQKSASIMWQAIPRLIKNFFIKPSNVIAAVIRMLRHTINIMKR